MPKQTKTETPAQSLRRSLAEAGVEVLPSDIERGAEEAVKVVGNCPRCGRDTRYNFCLRCNR